jgi:hypothetical protein
MSRANPFGQSNAGGWCRCSECGRIFGGLTGFDRHKFTTTGQPGYDSEFDWRCATDAELVSLGVAQDQQGWWVRLDGYSDLRVGTRTAPEAAEAATADG